jgi:hypothetical protein
MVKAYFKLKITIGQINPSLVDKTLMEEKKKKREDIPSYTPLKEADAWQNGNIYQLKFEKMQQRR